MKLSLLASKVRRKFAREGVAGVVAGLRRNLSQRHAADAFDAAHGVDTGGIAQLWRYTVQAASAESAETGGAYQAIHESLFRSAMAFLEGRQGEFTLVDIGTGKGRPLIIGAWLGFRRVIGVEFAVELAEVARANLATLGIANGEVVTGDAALFGFPREKLVAFLYGGTLDEGILRRVLENVTRIGPGIEAYLVHTHPVRAAVLDAHPAFEADGTSPDGQTRRWRLRLPAP
ncbi:MAG: hypothetical protein K2X11_11540 [Acetobacteraceae bacterium]|nr:hypothetical protein [Acetobacteraceae bacterium]